MKENWKKELNKIKITRLDHHEKAREFFPAGFIENFIQEQLDKARQEERERIIKRAEEKKTWRSPDLADIECVDLDDLISIIQKL